VTPCFNSGPNLSIYTVQCSIVTKALESKAKVINAPASAKIVARHRFGGKMAIVQNISVTARGSLALFQILLELNCIFEYLHGTERPAIERICNG
jgi:hypothetical protein